MLEGSAPGDMARLAWIAMVAAQGAGLYVAATLVFDVIHYLLHGFARSRLGFLRRLGALHQTHHEFFNRELRFVDGLTQRNLREHVIPEFLTHIVVALAGLWIVAPTAVAVVVAFQVVQFILVVRCGGRDSNHVAFDRLRTPSGLWVVGPRYHALHHLHPEGYFSSFVKLFDTVFGTACPLQGRRVALTGATGAFGSALKPVLERGGATVRALKFGVDYAYDDYARLDAVLAETDLLVLAHGSKKEFAMQANCDSFVAIIERFLSLQEGRRFPGEIWALGSEIELHPAWGNADLQVYLESKRAFARHAYGYYRDDRVVYRHICPAGFNSRMGWAPLSARMAVAMAMVLIRRGARYVPVTYTGLAFLNYFKFLFHRGEPRPATGSNASAPA
jgi:sterol desaturase/sphingolipid hydroxylase (fatty acid hydroxylase superfamily)